MRIFQVKDYVQSKTDPDIIGFVTDISKPGLTRVSWLCPFCKFSHNSYYDTTDLELSNETVKVYSR